MLVAAMNPCPCGYFSHPDRTCVCGPGIIKQYLSRISGPLLDRIDMHVEVSPVEFQELSGGKDAEDSTVMRNRVLEARSLQQKRFAGCAVVRTNSRMNSGMRTRYCCLDPGGKKLIEGSMTKLKLSVRAYDRILKVARTIADLAGSDTIRKEHVSEAVLYRNLDREGWSG
jgi:magnesium chelatase family protein